MITKSNLDHKIDHLHFSSFFVYRVVIELGIYSMFKVGSFNFVSNTSQNRAYYPVRLSIQT
jgi:hypothetical protein